MSLVQIQPFGGGQAEWVAAEVPVAISVNGISQAVMLASPSDLEDFAWGFARSEGWIASAHELLDVDLTEQAQGMVLELRVLASVEQNLKARRRALAGTTGCGLCGVASLDQLPRMPTLMPQEALRPDALQAALKALPAAQVLNAQCGGLHAAAWCDLEGRLLLVREDIGRHNALDKLCGAHLRAGSSGAGWVLMSSRASFELVHKAATVGAVALACVSAPSSLAVQAARVAGLQLWAFVRPDRATRYA